MLESFGAQHAATLFLLHSKSTDKQFRRESRWRRKNQSEMFVSLG
jgi:hypothetical protein